MNEYSYNGGYETTSMDHGDQYGTNDAMMMGPGDVGNGILGGQSLDDIVDQNAKNIRRQSMPQHYGASTRQADMDMRRISMMHYNNATSAGAMHNFDFDTGENIDQNGMMNGTTSASLAQNNGSAAHSRRESRRDLNLNTSYAPSTQGFNSILNSTSAFASPAHGQNGMDMASPYIDPNLNMSMDYGLEQLPNDAMNGDGMNMNLYNQPQFSNSVMNSPMHANPSQGTPSTSRTASYNESNNNRSGPNTQYGGQSVQSSNGTVRGLERSRSIHLSDMNSPAGGDSTPTSQPQIQPQQPTQNLPPPGQGFKGQPQNPPRGSAEDRGMHRHEPMQYDYKPRSDEFTVDPSKYNPNNQGFDWEEGEGGWPSTMVNRPHMQSSYKHAYSSTGFDMLGVLMRVATRPNPEINIGAVDLSCAFVVCDAEKDDIPIVYCSDNFERLTGYTKHMILGRNCRFLQSPDGTVAPGHRRKYVDDDSVLYLKNMINLRREAQISLINYRRGGQPFMNLLTMIPITWETDQVKFFVGFQVDLVEQPNAVTNKNPDGSYSINYQRGMTMPRYVLNAPDGSQKADLGQTVPRDDVSAILTTIGTGESEYAKRMWDKVLLENTDDVVHVLSLKGLFQWVSPSALRVLEYEPSEIIGTALSSVCHPSDIVPVTRELKDTSSGASVNVVFRIRRKNSGYMWFEGHGSLHTEQGKGRKSIIMVGRERPVYTLSKSEIVNAGGIGENELWTKMSTSGMFLYVSSNVRQLLDRQPDELVGVSIQTLMRSESKNEFSRILEHARMGKKASVKHEMINRRGQVMSAFTTLYPGDATEGLKPTFIVAQTRLIKYTRGTQPIRPTIYAKSERPSNESLDSTSQSQTQTSVNPTGAETPNSGVSSSQFVGTNEHATTYAGQNGLVIGHQDVSLASEDNLFDELKATKSSSWQYEIRQLEKRNRMLAEEVQALIAAKKKRKRRKNGSSMTKDCANCHTKVTPEWRRGPSGQRDLCNSCGLRWAKLNGRISPRASSKHSVSDKGSKVSVSSNPARGGGTGAQQQQHPPNPVKTESSQTQASSHQQTPKPNADCATTGLEPKESLNAMRPLIPDGHAASMEGACGVPDKIDEGTEPG
ncbi:hypothetical protein LTR78_008723 [Recurvomyces mirabilis]|uniref:White collar 1 protein n=1 Tax=Recurvomyces mirabilis TaxID=574656 RepID=A0AAE0WGV8_9PEZI|nr:hypothetical protein LTR78_008723 [Recurvomyces mirabilis]KAK5159192.1 hypothetical protein LTS14_002334 [Recurvomyces mirabilis]